MNNLFKKAPRSPKLIPDEDWFFPTLPSEQNSFSHPPRLNSSINFSEEVVKTIGYKLKNFDVNS